MRFLAFMTCCFAVLTLSAKEFFLVENGQPRAGIVIAPDFTTQEAYAAAELSAYLEKLTGARVPVSLTPAQGSYPVYLTRSAARLPRPSRPEPSKTSLPIRRTSPPEAPLTAA